MGLVVTGATLLVVVSKSQPALLTITTQHLTPCLPQYPLLQTIYTLHFGPLSHLSGPRLWAATRLPFLLSLMRGRITHDLAALHRRHGPIVRITPDEVSFTDPSAWSDILQPKPGGRHFTKHPSWYGPLPGLPPGLVLATSPDQHAAMRRYLSPAFSARALRAQEPVIRAYVDLLLTRLRGLAGAEVDVVPWFNYLTFDIVGDLGFGRSFGCLESSAYHAWIALILDTSKAIVFVGSARFYPYLFAALMWLVPEKALKAQREHTQYVVDCIERRLGMEGERPDMLGQVVGKEKKGKGKGLDVLGLSSLFQEVVIAGSETTAMALSAAVSLLVQDEEKMGVLVREVRGGEITADATRELPYLNAVLQETLRVAPPFPWLPSRVVPEGGGTVCGVWLPGGTAVSIPIAAMHKSPASFHDSEGFHPERWLPEAATDPESPFYNDKRNASQPFILGPRQCIGINTAWMEMRLTMAKVLWTFDIAAPSDKSKLVKFDMLRSLMLLEKKPIPVMLKLREFKNG
ncbi:cytochrome P450 [Schizothecium vesticola]|uniref:Cytochrome P450 n=1 Tax=Schizothecium vesticola TaxID=314040 RepID=A0AA40F7V7_9PEZI|nr:cytochrome P450 [Schizothecium vesticola]